MSGLKFATAPLWAASVLGALLLAVFGVLADRFRPFEGKDPGDYCSSWGMTLATAAERDRQPFYLRQFFCSPEGSGEVFTSASPAAIGTMSALLPVGLALFLAGSAALVTRARRPDAAVVPPAGTGARQAAGWALADGAAWALFPSVTVYFAFGYWEAVLGYAAMIIACSAAVVSIVETLPGGFGLRRSLLRWAGQLALALAGGAFLGLGGGIFTIIAFAAPPLGGALVVFPVAAALSWCTRRKAHGLDLAHKSGLPNEHSVKNNEGRT